MNHLMKIASRALVIVVISCAPVSCNAQTRETAKTSAAREVYVKYGCYECHGYEGQGAETGSRLAPDPLPREAFMFYVRHPARRMPPYAPSVLPDEDLEKIYEYLLARPEPSSLESIPLLSDGRE